MQRKTRYAVAVLLIVVGVGSFYAGSSQGALTRRIKNADRVIFASNVPGYEDLNITVTGDDVSKVVQAVANGRRLSPNVSCTPESRLEFFKGSAHLVTITNCVSVFWINLTPYEDTSGMLEKLTQKRRDEYDERRMKSF